MSPKFAGIITALTGLSVRATNQIVIFGVTLVAAHFLAPAAFGVFSIASAVIALIRTLMYTGSFEYLLKAPAGEEAPTECLLLNFVLAIAFSAALVILAPVSSLIFGTGEVGYMLLLMAPSNLMSAYAAWQESQVLRSKRVKAYYAITAMAEVVAGAGAVILLSQKLGLIALVGQMYLRCIALIISYAVIQKPYWSETFSRTRFSEIFKWSLSRYGSTFVSFMSGYGADFFLGALLSPAATGIYRAGNRVVTAVSDIFSHPTQILSATIFSRFAAEGRSPKEIWPRMFGASAFLGWSALAGLAAISERIVPILLGSQWKGTGLVVALLCAARAFSLVDAVTVPLLVAFNKAHAVFRIQMATAIGSIVLLFAVARFGVAAAAMTSIFVSALTTFGYGIYCLRNFPGSGAKLKATLAISILPALAAFAAAKACLSFISPSFGATPGSILSIGAGILGWCVVVVVLRRAASDVLHALNA